MNEQTPSHTSAQNKAAIIRAIESQSADDCIAWFDASPAFRIGNAFKKMLKFALSKVLSFKFKITPGWQAPNKWCGLVVVHHRAGFIRFPVGVFDLR